MVLFAIVAKNMSGLRPQRAEAFLPAFAEEPDLKWSYQLQIADLQVDDLLHPRPCIEHGCQQGVVAAAMPTGGIDSGKNHIDLGAIKVLDHALTSALEGYAQNALNPVEVVGVIRPHITEESVDGG